jgi:hypothetical protein
MEFAVQFRRGYCIHTLSWLTRRVPDVPCVRVEDFMVDLEVRGGVQTAENRTVVANAIKKKRKLARCELIENPS